SCTTAGCTCTSAADRGGRLRRKPKSPRLAAAPSAAERARKSRRLTGEDMTAPSAAGALERGSNLGANDVFTRGRRSRLVVTTPDRPGPNLAEKGPVPAPARGHDGTPR